MSRRLLLSYLALTLILLAALEIPLAVSNDRRLRTDLTSNLVRDAYTMSSYVEGTVEGKGTVDLGQVAANYADRTGGRVVIVDANGATLADSASGTADSFSSRPEIEAALAGNVSTGTRQSATLGTDLLYVAVPIASAQGVQGALRITYATAQIDQRRRDYLVTLLGVGVVSLLVAALLGLLLARWVSGPIRHLERAAARLGGRDLTTRADEDTGPPELRELAHTFNQMAERIDELVSSQAAFVADASHQLRTPLAALQLRLENLQAEWPDADDGPFADPEERRRRLEQQAREDVEAGLAETARLSRIVDDLLVLARAETAARADTEDVDVDQLLAERVETFRPVATERHVDLVSEAGGLHVRAAPDVLAQVVDNLVANAIDASPPGGTIVVGAMPGPRRAGTGPAMIEIHIVDDGPGLTDAERKRAFDRFWRASRDRPSASTIGGTGLGLAIARQLARAGGGDVELRVAPGRGIDAVVTMPTAT